MTDVQRTVKNQIEKPKDFKNRSGNINQFQKNQFQTDTQKNFKMKKSGKTYAEQMEGIDKSELERRKVAGECQGCARPAD